LLFKVNKSEKVFANKIGSIIRFEEIHFATREFFINAESQLILQTFNMFLDSTELVGKQAQLNKRKPHLEEIRFHQQRDKTMAEVCPFVKASGGV